MPSHLTPIIEVDSEACVNCHACISVCPVKYCIDGSGDVVTIDHDRCIGCGKCISVCTHEARRIRDDVDTFLDSCRRGEPIVAIVAPAAASSFPNEYLRLNSWLRSMGVSAVFDVGFGAELTIRSYEEYLQREHPRLVLAQPCPVIVSYIELYRPELIEHLAPYDSPMLHTMKLIREYYPAFARHRIAAISPCIAKRREFDEVGVGDFNVTFASLLDHFKRRGIALSSFEPVPFDGPEAERGVLFPSPGGLTRTLLRDRPDLQDSIRRIEGPDIVYDYLSELHNALDNGTAPLLIDCLNCEMGCNGGPGTLGERRHLDELERPIELRASAQRARYGKRPFLPAGRKTSSRKLTRTIGSYWKDHLYRRSYRDRSHEAAVKIPTEPELQRIFRSMLKESQKDFYNCSACGYGSCRAMAIAIYNGLNKPENCLHYQKQLIERMNRRLVEMSQELDADIQGALASVDTLSDAVDLVKSKCLDQVASVEESSAAIEQMIGSIRKVSKVTNDEQDSVQDLVRVAVEGKAELERSIDAVNGAASSIEQVNDILRILDNIASNTNLLSINASIEAAHAGTAGRGFAVVASEIRRLASSAGENAHLVAERLALVIEEIRDTAELSDRTGGRIRDVIGGTEEIAGVLSSFASSMHELSAGSEQITAALRDLLAITAEFKNSYDGMLASVEEIRAAMDGIARLSRRTLEYANDR